MLRDMGWARALANSLVRDGSVAEDLVQEACLAALSHVGTGERWRGRSWLAVVLRNAARALARGQAHRRDRERVAARSEALPSSAELVERMECQRVLAEAVTALDEPIRSTLILRYGDELSAGEIARRQGVDEATVRRRIQRGLERLRADLDRRFGGGEAGRRAWASALVPKYV